MRQYPLKGWNHWDVGWTWREWKWAAGRTYYDGPIWYLRLGPFWLAYHPWGRPVWEDE